MSELSLVSRVTPVQTAMHTCTRDASARSTLSRARDAPLDRIRRIAEPGRRRMARRYQSIVQPPVCRRELIIKRGVLAVPLRLGARARDSGCHKRVVEHPQYGELPGDHATSLGVLLDRLREAQRC